MYNFLENQKANLILDCEDLGEVKILKIEIKTKYPENISSQNLKKLPRITEMMFLVRADNRGFVNEIYQNCYMVLEFKIKDGDDLRYRHSKVRFKIVDINRKKNYRDFEIVAVCDKDGEFGKYGVWDRYSPPDTEKLSIWGRFIKRIFGR